MFAGSPEKGEKCRGETRARESLDKQACNDSGKTRHSISCSQFCGFKRKTFQSIAGRTCGPKKTKKKNYQTAFIDKEGKERLAMLQGCLPRAYFMVLALVKATRSIVFSLVPTSKASTNPRQAHELSTSPPQSSHLSHGVASTRPTSISTSAFGPPGSGPLLLRPHVLAIRLLFRPPA